MTNEDIMNGLVYEMHFPEELHAAGLRLFDLVAQAQLPDLATVSDPQRLPRQRTHFETVLDGAQPMKIALDQLQTLDPVRIVEGKA